MVKIQMLVSISGGRGDGTSWPAAGGPLECSDSEAQDLIRAGLARPWTEPQAPGEAASAPSEPEPPAPEPEDPAATLEPPKPGDPKAAWVEYAVAHGTDRAEAEQATKQDLIAAYGGRP